jgi:hypothetical protein
LRNFLSLSYDDAQLNLKAKGQRRTASRRIKFKEDRIKYLREAHQGGHRIVQRPRRPPAHAGLRQKFLIELGQSDIRWLRRFADLPRSTKPIALGDGWGVLLGTADVFGSVKFWCSAK